MVEWLTLDPFSAHMFSPLAGRRFENRLVALPRRTDLRAWLRTHDVAYLAAFKHSYYDEQAQGQPATAESDIYSSGIVLYEMLTGRVPFAADNPLATAMQHITQQPIPPRMLVPTLPAAVDGVVLKALHKDPRGRFHSGAALVDALATAVAPPIRPASGAAYGRPAVSARPNPQAHAARTVHVPRPPAGSPSRRSIGSATWSTTPQR